ncbi:thiamine pyrophosphate-binding protein [Streptomyces sp. NPDC052225]|uniref:thiamine pyrophosphate-binding protein n=1 Tax=Streptomyces sp. NPDC052225 TaxID=3154949 RepID=UPI00341CF10D
MTHDHDLVLSPTPRQIEAALNPPPGRTGGDLVVETLAGLGASTVFGLPGQHALGLFDALGRCDLIRYVGLRTELGAGFAADAYGRVSGEVAPLFVSAGPGALMTLPALQEAAAASAPVLVVASQVPVAGLGGGRHGHLHELRDQQAAFRDVVKSVHAVRTQSQIPSAIAEAWESALSAPHGPVYVEIPQDVLLAPARLPAVTAADATPHELVPRPELTAVAAHLLANAARPVIIAGGGVVRADAAGKLKALAEKVSAPVVCTYGGKGAFPRTHPLSLRTWPDDRRVTDFLEDADVVLAVGTGLGELTTHGHAFAPRGQVIQVDADAGKLEANHPALGIHADARLALQALLETVEPRPDDQAPARVAQLLAAAAPEQDPEQALLTSIREALPPRAASFWDLTPLTARAWTSWPGAMHSAQGAGAPGYAFPAALGAAVADPTTPVLAVSDTTTALHTIAELATARQESLNVTWLIVEGTEGAPDFTALAESFAVPAVRASPDSLREDLTTALKAPGPRVVVLPAAPRP